MDVEKLFKEYRDWKRDMGLLEFELSRFEGIPYDDVIESLCLSQPQKEWVQSRDTSDKTGKTAIIYRQVKESLDNEWFDYLIDRYKTMKENVDFFEYAIRQLSGRLPEIMRDMVVEEMSWRELEGKYNVSHAMIGKYRKKAVAELSSLYENRDRHSETYLLG